MSYPILFIAFLLFVGNIHALTIRGIVTRIHDGDTLTVKLDDAPKPRNIRFLGVDTPEVDYNGHTQGEMAFIARDYLISLVPIGSQIEIHVESEYQLNRRRILGTVFFNGVDINLKMIESGLAVPYFIAPMDKSTLKTYSMAAKNAYEEKLGLYDQNIPLPYEFRLIVSGREGTNFVGDLETKILYYPGESAEIPPYRRYFINGLERARQLGFSLKN
ncbi:MAG: thermonuclease family protein [Bacteriovoracaceae bacterium]|nr:thermonuclease family protein [Bacteriovoracaceae bacterium]